MKQVIETGGIAEKWTERAMHNRSLSLPQEHHGRGPLINAVASSQSFPKGAEAQISSSERNGFALIGGYQFLATSAVNMSVKMERRKHEKRRDTVRQSQAMHHNMQSIYTAAYAMCTYYRQKQITNNRLGINEFLEKKVLQNLFDIKVSLLFLKFLKFFKLLKMYSGKIFFHLFTFFLKPACNPHQIEISLAWYQVFKSLNEKSISKVSVTGEQKVDWHCSHT